MSNTAELTLFSANRLHDGIVVWLGENNEWVQELPSASLFDQESIEAARDIAQQASDQNFVVGVQELPATRENNIPVPCDYKERIRSKGPSVRLDLGKQSGDATNGNPAFNKTLQPRQANSKAGIY